MHTLFNRAIAFTAADLATGTVSLAPLGSESAAHAKSNVATIAVPKRVRKLTGKAVAAKPAAKPAKAKPVAADTDKPVFSSGSYLGASPAFRPHGGKLSPIVFGRIAGSFTDRDSACLHDLYAAYAGGKFERCDAKRGINIDAGAASRLEAHGYLSHISGDPALKTCVMQLTARGVKYCKPVSVPTK